MGTFAGEIDQLITILNNFGAMHKQGKEDAELSMRAVKDLTDKVAKYDKKLMEDGRKLVDRLKYVRQVEASVDQWEKQLAAVKKMKDSDSFKPFEGSSVVGKLDKTKPAKAQVVAAIESFLESEIKRAKGIVADQQGELGRMQKHIEKFRAAIEAIKKVNESIQVG